MRKPCIPELIYSKTFPRAKQGDPVSFYAHIQRHIVGEVRVEVQNFYGALDTLEAQYPGLDYSFPPHRRRLSRYPWHRRLFRVFDELGLTDNEILNLCQWEGTRAAKERYEREAHTQVKTTTADDVVAAPRGSGPRAVFEDLSRSPSEDHVSDSDTLVELPEKEESDQKQEDNPDDGESADNYVFTLIRDAMRSHLGGHAALANVNQAWEQWLRETLERHELDIDSVMATIRSLGEDPLGGSGEATDGLRTPPRSPTPQLVSGPAAPFHDVDARMNQLESDSTRLVADDSALALFLRRSRTEAAR